MNRLRLTLIALALAGSVAGGAAAAPEGGTLLPLPHWLSAAQKQTLDKVFGGEKPVHTYYVSYPRKIAVIFEFDRAVSCRTCSGPSNASVPRGKVGRVSFDRDTHRLNGSMRFCESVGDKPPRALCIRR